MCKCNNCEWTGEPTIKLGDIPDLFQRIDPGDTVPAGECPECGALCYEEEPEVATPTAEAVAQAAATCDEVAEWLTGSEPYEVGVLANALTKSAMNLRSFDTSNTHELQSRRADALQWERVARMINEATPGFHSAMGSECDHAEVALGKLLKDHAKAKTTCTYLVSTIENTGGIVSYPDGSCAPVEDPEWIDLGEAYQLAKLATKEVVWK